MQVNSLGKTEVAYLAGNVCKRYYHLSQPSGRVFLHAMHSRTLPSAGTQHGMHLPFRCRYNVIFPRIDNYLLELKLSDLLLVSQLTPIARSPCRPSCPISMKHVTVILLWRDRTPCSTPIPAPMRR